MNKKELTDLLYKAIDFINNKPEDRIAPNCQYDIKPSKTSGYDRCYINIIKQVNENFWLCSIITISDRIFLSKEEQYGIDWLYGLFKSATNIKVMSEVRFHDKWNEAERIIKQIQEL